MKHCEIEVTMLHRVAVGCRVAAGRHNNAITHQHNVAKSQNYFLCYRKTWLSCTNNRMGVEQVSTLDDMGSYEYSLAFEARTFRCANQCSLNSSSKLGLYGLLDLRVFL